MSNRIFAFSVVWLFVLAFVAPGGVLDALAQSEAATERNIRDAILERITPDAAQIQEMDLNFDGKIDVADLVIQQDREQSETAMNRRFVGSMVFDPDFVLSAQKIEMVLPDVQSAFTAEITPEDSLLFSEPFNMSGTLSSGMPVFTSTGSGALLADDSKNPLHRSLSWDLTISETALEDGVLTGRFTMNYEGLKLEPGAFTVAGDLYMAEQFTDDESLLEDADNLDQLVDRYGL